MSRLIWIFHRSVRIFGPAGATGGVLLLGVALFNWGVLVPGQSNLLAIQATSANMAAHLVLQRPLPIPISTEEQLAQFYNVLPEASGAVLADAVAKMVALAQVEALVLEQGSYRLASDGAVPLVRFEMVFPVKTSYPQLRRFLRKALQDMPTLALESVNFSRPTIADASVDAQLRFTLYVRKL